ncbi:hypothetical protein OIO90_004171 [Microbotryomycetes sp. JL221]|nr:hypothetical protein OIO90_004171 [Microbotryomycetes sp. JL221]
MTSRMDAIISRPPSPPRSTSSKSSPLILGETTTEPTPPKSPDDDSQQMNALSNVPIATLASATTNMTPPVTFLTSPLPSLPVEAFLLVLQHVDTNSRLSLRLVSRSWNSFISTEPSLWSHLNVHIPSSSPEYIATRLRLAGVAQTSRGGTGVSGGIKSLRLSLDGIYRQGDQGRQLHDAASWQQVKQSFQHLQLEMQARSSVRIAGDNCDGRGVRQDIDGGTERFHPSTLRMLSFHGDPNSATTILFLQELTETQWLYHNVTHLDVFANVPPLTIGGEFLSYWPNVRHLRLRFIDSMLSHWQIPSRWQPHNLLLGRIASDYAIDELVNLESIECHFTNFDSSLDMLWVPKLTSIRLHSCLWEGTALFQLLRMCRSTLHELILEDFEMTELPDDDAAGRDVDDNVWTDNPRLFDSDQLPLDQAMYQNEDSRPPPIRMRALRTLSMFGTVTPPVWASKDNFGNNTAYHMPLLEMPALETADIRDMAIEAEIVDGQPGALPLLGHLAPNLRRLELSTIAVEDSPLYLCLGSMGGLRTLELFQTDVTDRLIVNLDTLVPELEHLWVSDSSYITNQGVARCVERLRDARGQRVKSVRVDAPRPDDSYDEWRAREWLVFHNLLFRDDKDWTGTGPKDPNQNKQWKRYGKTSEEVQLSLPWLYECRRTTVARAVQLNHLYQLAQVNPFVARQQQSWSAMPTGFTSRPSSLREPSPAFLNQLAAAVESPFGTLSRPRLLHHEHQALMRQPLPSNVLRFATLPPPTDAVASDEDDDYFAEEEEDEAPTELPVTSRYFPTTQN